MIKGTHGKLLSAVCGIYLCKTYLKQFILKSSLDIKVTVGSMIMGNILMFQNCCSSQAVTDILLKLGRAVEKIIKVIEK